MKKTYTINLSGKIFHVDEDALDMLQNYINTLKIHYTKEDDGNEIMDDIENRISELFTEYLKGGFREVVNLADVNKVISTMGRPDDIFEEEAESETPLSKQPKKLYRDPDDRVLGGVASGIASYWGLPKLLVRICCVVLTLYYGLFFIVYMILWIAVPVARTAKQKLEMKGEDINVSNIERSIKEECQEIKNGKGSRFMQHCEKSISTTLRILGQIICIILGVGLLVGGIFFLLTFLSILLLPHLFPWGENFDGIAYAFTETNLTLIKIALSILGIVPILLMIFASIKLLFRFRSNNKVIILSSLGVWLIGLIMLIFVGVREGKTWSPSSTSYGESIDLNDCKTLVININERYTSPSRLAKNGLYRIVEDNKVNLLQRPELSIIPTDDSIPSIAVNYRTYKEAKTYNNPDFNWTYQNDTLSFDNFFDLEEVWRGQVAKISIYIPENVKLQFTPKTAEYIKTYNILGWQIRSHLHKNKLQFVMDDRQLQPVQ